MRLILLNCSIIFWAAAGAHGQADRGTIAGMMTDPYHEGVLGATVQATNEQTGTVSKAITIEGGRYTLTNVSAGAYDVSVAVPGLSRYERKSVQVQAGKTFELNILLQEGVQLSTLGEDRLARAADLRRHAPPSGPVPRTADGKPDFTGVWWSAVTVDTGNPEWLPAAQAIARQRTETNWTDSPQTHCKPSAVLRTTYPLVQFAQTSRNLIIIYDDDSPGFHQVYLDGRGHPPVPDTDLWYGDSVGRWDGETLVVDRISFSDQVWLDQQGHPHSDRLHVIERYRRRDLGHMEIEITVDDPGVLARPFTMKGVADLANESIREFICTENERDIRHLGGK